MPFLSTQEGRAEAVRNYEANFLRQVEESEKTLTDLVNARNERESLGHESAYTTALRNVITQLQQPQ